MEWLVAIFHTTINTYILYDPENPAVSPLVQFHMNHTHHISLLLFKPKSIGPEYGRIWCQLTVSTLIPASSLTLPKSFILLRLSFQLQPLIFVTTHYWPIFFLKKTFRFQLIISVKLDPFWWYGRLRSPTVLGLRGLFIARAVNIVY